MKFLVKEVPVLEIDSSFFQFLTSVVALEQTCPYYTFCLSGFIFKMHSNFDTCSIQILSQNTYTYDYSNCSGVFDFSGMRFVCEGTVDERLLRYTTKRKTIKFSPMYLRGEEPNYDDRFSSWRFVFKDHKIKLTSCYPCSMLKN
jgi:hypothetical protein